MSKPTRSPVLGYNHNVRYRGRVFHVQTEDSGPVNPRVFTHLYFGGTILASKRHEYDAASAPEVVRSLMQSQHKAILKDLKNGRHDAQLLRFFEARGETLGPATPPSAGDELAGDALALSEPPTPTPLPVAVAPPVSGPVSATATGPAPTVTFADDFDHEPTRRQASMGTTGGTPLPVPVSLSGNPRDTLAFEAAEARRAGTPAQGSVRVDRIRGVGGSTPTPTPVTSARVRRPAPAIPYVVQEGSHPVLPEAAGASSGVGHTSPGTTAPNLSALSPGPGAAPPPLSPPAPLVPPTPGPEAAPVTSALPATNLGATPTQTVTREESQSMDEVIMSYLSRNMGGGDVGKAG